MASHYLERLTASGDQRVYQLPNELSDAPKKKIPPRDNLPNLEKMMDLYDMMRFVPSTGYRQTVTYHSGTQITVKFVMDDMEATPMCKIKSQNVRTDMEEHIRIALEAAGFPAENFAMLKLGDGQSLNELIIDLKEGVESDELACFIAAYAALLNE